MEGSRSGGLCSTSREPSNLDGPGRVHHPHHRSACGHRGRAGRARRASRHRSPGAGGIVSLDALSKSLTKGPKPLYLIVGDARPLVERGVQAVVDAVLPDCGPPAFNVNRYRASDAGAAPFKAAATLPMMAGTPPGRRARPRAGRHPLHAGLRGVRGQPQSLHHGGGVRREAPPQFARAGRTGARRPRPPSRRRARCSR